MICFRNDRKDVSASKLVVLSEHIKHSLLVAKQAVGWQMIMNVLFFKLRNLSDVEVLEVVYTIIE